MPPECADHDAELADLFNIHAALVRAEKLSPILKDSPRWKLMRMDAYEALYRAMEGQA